MLIKNFI